ncbi:MAG TPA: DUF885 domain-containing protein [Acidobacteriaceae bacterium]|nr:DUF885 domain-containing protein [Acidobacteriaceae bacterium]
MKKIAVSFLAALLTSFVIPNSFAQTFPKSVQKQAEERSSFPGTINAQAAPQSLADREAALKSLFAEIWQDRLEHDPEFASSIGDKRYDDQLTDRSVAAYNEALARGRGYLIRLGQIDDTGMTDQEKLSRELMVRELVDRQEEAEFKPWEMPMTQFNGIQIDLPELVSLLTFETAKDYDDYTARLNKIPLAIQQVTNNAMTGIEDQRVPPKYILQKVLAQVNAIANQKPEDTPFAQPLKKFPAGISAAEQTRIRTEVLDAIRKKVLPAYQQLSRFLTKTYIPAGRTDPGIWAIPDGSKYYDFLVKQSTTTDLTPAQIHQIGLEQVAKDEAEMTGIAHKLGFKDLAALRASIPKNPKLHAQSPEQLIDLYKHYIDQMRPKLPELFNHLPKAKLVVKTVPTYMQQDQTQAYYEQGSADGKRPGAVYVNLYKYQDRLLTNVESVSYHEGIPGHHLQISLAQEMTGVPAFRRYTYYTAYTEGWALYAEHLGKDIGFYQDPYQDYGRLEADEWRAIRLVVDTGVHSMHWSRQQMIDYFRAHSSMDETNIEEEVDRYIAWPAQALGYKIGQMKILELRAKAKKELGPKYDIRNFDDEVVDSGALPLDILEQRVDAWIKAGGGEPGR